MLAKLCVSKAALKVPPVHCPQTREKFMGKAEKLVLSKETLRNLDDQDLTGVVGGTGTIICVESALCNSGICSSVICSSVVCQLDSVVCL